ncbi:hypothetical protein IJH23_01705 [Candidatus Saccharibacteria bacterium]|nr:hypothetical protein [Candidatus Saccharibacteria bacterium]
MQSKKGQNKPSAVPFSWAEFLSQLEKKYSGFRFVEGRKFAFRPPRTIVFNSSEKSGDLLILHEIGHALSGHRFFGTDVERIKIEVEAWEKARELAKLYGVEFNEDLVQEELDTYRDWLHKKSRCPNCGLTRFQTQDSVYHCPNCDN